MSLQQIKQFFLDLQLWQKVAATIIAAIILGLSGFLWRILKRKKQEREKIHTTTQGPQSPTQVASGTKIQQTLDASYKEFKGPIVIAQPGATVIINTIDYQDGIAQTIIPKVKNLFEAARTNYAKGEFADAIERFKLCLDLETDPEKRGALNLQIGNCYYPQQHYLKAAGFYAEGLKEGRKANDPQGQASNLVSLANTYLLRPASDSRVRGDNIRTAVGYYTEALQTFVKDEYPVDYATTQNNLGLAYTDLPAATPQERADNVRKAIDCYKAALKIRKKDEYPQKYCSTAANMGMILLSIDDKNACYWLKEAYALREYLPDQGKGLEPFIKQICKEQ